jgi:ligand-binding SRPBCC domain-containing protein
VQITFRQTLETGRDELFAFHEDPSNLAALLEGWKGFQLVSHSGHIRPGARTSVVQTLGPLRFRFEFEHFLLEKPVRFGERAVRGPFRRFEHVHEFLADGGKTTILDRLDFELPWRWGGRVAERWVALPALRRFFAFREESYRRLIASGRIGSR